MSFASISHHVDHFYLTSVKVIWVLPSVNSDYFSKCQDSVEINTLLLTLNPTCSGGGAHCARPSENMLLFFTVWSEGPQILVQFIYHSDIGCTESLEPKVCLRKKLEHIFWCRCQKSKVQKWENDPENYPKPCAYKKLKTFVFLTMFI